ADPVLDEKKGVVISRDVGIDPDARAPAGRVMTTDPRQDDPAVLLVVDRRGPSSRAPLQVLPARHGVRANVTESYVTPSVAKALRPVHVEQLDQQVGLLPTRDPLRPWPHVLEEPTHTSAATRPDGRRQVCRHGNDSVRSAVNARAWV